MYNRYNNSQQIINNAESYSELFKEKKVNFIKQYNTYDFGKLKLIESSNVERTLHVVQPFEKLYMISQKYYNSPEFGWIICYTNRLGNELLIKTGDTLNIYFPLDNILELL